jgi:ankyrin repeat protein
MVCNHHQEATPEELSQIRENRLHLNRNASGWSMLHAAAAAAHNVKLAQQLLDLGADPAVADVVYGLTPLHLACMGRVRDGQQLAELLTACRSLPSLQVMA